MKVKFFFGAVLCAGLAYGAMSLAGVFENGVSIVGLLAATLLAVIYFTAFRAGFTSGRTIVNAKAATRKEAPIEYELDEIEGLVAVAA